MTRLADRFEVRRRFFRSVQVARDAHRRDASEGYALTALGAGILGRIVDGARPGRTARAWSLTGPYGAGKSAFVVFLTQLLASVPRDATATALHELGAVDRALEASVRSLADDTRRFCPVLVSGTYGPLLPSLLDALETAIRATFRPSAAQQRLLDATRALRASRSRSADLHARVIRLFDDLGAHVHARGGGGVLLVIDELGKALEHAARTPGRVDEVFLLQELAEMAARSADRPVVVVTLLHQAFDRYARDLGPETRAEWAKVQGRFEDLAFLEAPGELLRLTARAIRPREGSHEALRPYHALAAEAVALGLADASTEPTLRAVAPLHPSVALVLPGLFRGPLAQNERSLFGFLTAGVEDAFGAFLAATGERPGAAVSYTLDRLYDYVAATLGPAQLTGPLGRRWAAVDEAIARLPRDAPPLAARVVKAVGVLDLLGSRTVRASRAVVSFALAGPEATTTEVSAALDDLTASSQVVYRRFSDAYALWEGSDIDLDGRFDEARRRPPGVEALSAHLAARMVLRPVVARRHFIETGTLRYFDVALASGVVVEDDAREADGRIVYLVADGDTPHRELVAAASRAKASSDVVVGVPQEGRALLDAVRDWFAWESVRTSTAGLDGDPVARRELAARLHAASQRVDDDLQRCFGLAEGARVAWVHGGAVTSWRGARSLTTALSAVCDQRFPAAPLLRNELLNRRTLSSAAAGARRELLNAMVTRGAEPGLGLAGTPPERSMYESLLAAGGIHRARDGAWCLGPPPPDDPLRLRPAWEAIERFLDGGEAEARPLSALYATLREPPLGMREGPMPVLLLAVTLAHAGEVALFEDGTFLPELSEAVVERLLRRPEHFAASRHRVTGARAECLRALSLRLGGDATQRPVELVRAVVRRVASLPRHTRTTRRLPPGALAVRDAVLHARDPLRLLFVDLAAALGMPPLGAADDARVATFVAGLADALDALSAAYGELLSDIERSLAAAFSLDLAGEALRELLSTRARALLGVATDLRLRAFLGRAVEPSSEHGPWLEGVATVVHHRPPTEWSDGERERFELSLGEVRALFARAEALAQGATARVSVPAVGDPEAVERAERDILRVLEASLGARRDVWLAALGRTLNRVLDEGGGRGP